MHSSRSTLREKFPKVYFNHDLTPDEQRCRRPVYKDLRGQNIKCRLDRGSLVINNEQYYTMESARTAAERYLSIGQAQSPSAQGRLSLASSQ